MPTVATHGAEATDATSIWGRLVTYMRTSGAMRLYSLLGSHNDYEIDGDKLIVWGNDDNYLQLSEEETIKAIESGLKEDGLSLKVIVEKRARANQDKIIDKLKGMMGSTQFETKLKR